MLIAIIPSIATSDVKLLHQWRLVYIVYVLLKWEGNVHGQCFKSHMPVCSRVCNTHKLHGQEWEGIYNAGLDSTALSSIIYCTVYFLQKICIMHSCLRTTTCPGGTLAFRVHALERAGDNADSSGDDLPVASYKCQWVQPKKRKECNTKMAGSKFE